MRRLPLIGAAGLDPVVRAGRDVELLLRVPVVVADEEGLAAVLSRLAKRRAGLISETSIDGEVIDVAKAATTDLEVESLPGWLWRHAISQGFRAMHDLAENGGGYLIAELDERMIEG